MNDGLTIRSMRREEVHIAIEWAATEGWNPGLHDGDCFYTADREGFFLGLLDGEPVGTISAVTYGENFGFLGFYIVKPEFRGRGFGLQIWREALKHLDGRNVGLDSVVEQREIYERGGFFPAYRSIRYQGLGTGDGSTLSTVDVSEVSFDSLKAYDDQLFPAPRHQFLSCWIGQPDASYLGVMKDDLLVGYGVVRRCGTGFKIGPLFADDVETAELLFRDLSGCVPEGMPVFLDTPEPNAAAVSMAEDHGMEPVFETVRMYSKEEPDIPLDRWFGVTSFELG